MSVDEKKSEGELVKCGAKFVSPSGTYLCGLPLGHQKAPSMKHRVDGMSWTQGGADRVAREMTEAARKAVKADVKQ
jgi:hypothetical protein